MGEDWGGLESSAQKGWESPPEMVEEGGSAWVMCKGWVSWAVTLRKSGEWETKGGQLGGNFGAVIAIMEHMGLLLHCFLFFPVFAIMEYVHTDNRVPYIPMKIVRDWDRGWVWAGWLSKQMTHLKYEKKKPMGMNGNKT